MAECYSDTIREVNAYLADNDRWTPYFISLESGAEYRLFVTEFVHNKGKDCIMLHDYCRTEDSFPDIDTLLEKLKEPNREDAVLLGAGAAVCHLYPTLIEVLRDVVMPRKLLVPCRGGRQVLLRMAEHDPKFSERQLSLSKAGSNHAVEVYPPEFPLDAVHGIRNLLKALEDGGDETIRVITRQKLKDGTVIKSAYEAWRKDHPMDPYSEDMLPPDKWMSLVKEDSLDDYPIDHWRTYLRLKKAEVEKDSYLAFVLGQVSCAEKWRDGLIRSILTVPVSDRRFNSFFSERWSVLSKFEDSKWTDADGANFLAYAKQIPAPDRYCYYTNMTLPERKGILDSLSERDDIPNDLHRNDPRLAEYLEDYPFGGDCGTFLTPYFRKYKRCKVLNRIDPDFFTLVDRASHERPYNALPTRGSVLDKLKDGKTGLFWMDALGCEYLGYIQSLARKKNLSMRVTLARANLPTLTGYNNDFYDAWTEGVPRLSNKDLDDIIHDGGRGFDYRDVRKPLHLACELDVIDTALDWIITTLNERQVRRVILTSDHGASRLAVINEHETLWEMVTQGEHSGRCCLKTEIDGRPDCATEEECPDGKTFWVLANYDRFRGGRRASVEVHGGASIEEVVIPVIELSLADKKIVIENTTPEVRFGTDGVATLVLFSPNKLGDVSVGIDDNVYSADTQDGHTFTIPLPSLKRPGRYKAFVFEDGVEIEKFSFELQGRAARVRKDMLF